MTNEELGIWGETQACIWLVDQGHKIEARNFRFKKNEIDIVSRKDGFLVITEVKTRHSDFIGEPWRSVTRSKQRQIIKVANHYIVEGNFDVEVRFDILSIVHNQYSTKIEHIPSAFTPLA